MEIEIFTVSDFAVDNSGKLTIVGTFDNIYCQNVPVVHPSLYVSLKFRTANSEAGHHEFEIKAFSPDRKEIANVKGNANIMVNPHADYSAMTFVLQMHNLKFEKLGKYTFEFYFDGEFRSGLTLHLSKVPIEIGNAA